MNLSEAERRLVRPVPGGRGKARVDDRRVVNGICHVLRTASARSDLPERYGPHTTVRNRFDHRAKQGVRVAVFKKPEARSPRLSHMIAGSIVRAHRTAVPALLDGPPVVQSAIADRGCDSDTKPAPARRGGSANHILSSSRRTVRRPVDPASLPTAQPC